MRHPAPKEQQEYKVNECLLHSVEVDFKHAVEHKDANSFFNFGQSLIYHFMRKLAITLLLGFSLVVVSAQEQSDPSENQFRQMRTEFATPNAYRTASGAPGQLYWQQQANYQIAIELDDQNHKISGVEKIEYINNSPDQLNYL